MCGLTGILTSSACPESRLRATIGAMTARLRHRGPDAEGIWIGDSIALGHRRLSILDLSPAGAQPMRSACGRYIIAFNGEVYNHLELRRALEQKGEAPAWQGRSDTETLLAAFARWGVAQSLSKASGMFALALWDRRDRRLFLARDRMGEKPLYWGWVRDALVFGSELKAIAAHPSFEGTVSREAVAQYLRFGYVPAPRSIYAGIFKIEPGTMLEITAEPPPTPRVSPLRPGERYGSIAIEKYWSLTDVVEAGSKNPVSDENEAVTALDGVLRRAVGRQMISDVPLGAFLSGGIDSSTIVALLQAQSAQRVRTFTIGFDETGFDESPYATAVAGHLGTDHSSLRVTADDARAVIPHLPDMYDEPFADSSQIPTHLVCRAARAAVTVALSGDGGDELFGGYNRYFWASRVWGWLAWMPLPFRHGLGSGAQAVPVPAWDHLSTLLGRIGCTQISRLGDKAHKLGRRLKSVKGFDELYLSLVSEWPLPCELIMGNCAEPLSVLDDELPPSTAGDPVSQMMVQDMRTYLADDILCKVDRAAMHVGLETRAPFLDTDVVTLAARLPLSMKIRGNQGKWILRRVLDSYVPRSLTERPKMGFGIPVGAWLRGPLRDWAEELLSPEKLEHGGLLGSALVRQTWSEHLSGRRDWTSRLWIILMLQAWRARGMRT